MASDHYFPQRDLRAMQDSEGRRIPDSPYPHTQLGQQYSRKENPYNQAREFGYAGERRRDVDFTDHNDPQRHPNPHQHLYDSRTGRRGGQEPFDSNPEPPTLRDLEA